MYEFKHHSPISGFSRGDFDVKSLLQKAIMKFVNGPNLMTVANHVNLKEETPISCVREKDFAKIDFTVPKQDLVLRLTPEGHRYSVMRVTDSEGNFRKLVICENNRSGFLLEDIPA